MPWDSIGLLALVPTAAQGRGANVTNGPSESGTPGGQQTATLHGATKPRPGGPRPLLPQNPRQQDAPDHGKTSNIIFSSEFRISNLYLFANLIVSV